MGSPSEPIIIAQSFGVDSVASTLGVITIGQAVDVQGVGETESDTDLITGAVLWVDMSDAASFTHSGGFLSTYTDKISGEVYSEATNPPGYQATGFNGQPALNFDGANDRLLGTDAGVLAAITDGAPHTLYVVCHPDVVDASKAFFGWGTAADATANAGDYGTSSTVNGRLICRKINAAGTADNEEGGATPAGLTIGNHVFCFVHTAGNTTSGIVDDGTPDPNAGAQTWGDVNPGRFGFCVNARATPTFFGDGQFAEYRLYNSAHDAATITAITAHLIAKWGL